MKMRRAWMLALVLGCGPQPAMTTGETASTSTTTGEGTTTSTSTSTSTSEPTTSSTTDDSAGSSGSDTGMQFIKPTDGGGGGRLVCDCPEGQLCVVAQGIDSRIIVCVLPPAGCDPADLCSQACATACYAAPPLPDGCAPDVPPPEWVGCAPEHGGPCTTWAENCPEGQKCTPESSPLAFAFCAPIVADPALLGEPCETPFGEDFWADECEQGTLCAGVDPVDQGPVCVAHCKGDGQQPICPMGTGCRRTDGGGVAICLPACDPLGPPCADGTVCVPGETGFVCARDESGPLGNLHTKCSEPVQCDAGLTCVASSGVPGCENTKGRCCTPYCDIGAPTCPQGKTCVPLFEPGDAPSDWSHVGVCAGK